MLWSRRERQRLEQIVMDGPLRDACDE